jgi:pimeloyl-ACP methyl ester carboxylesterase
MAEDSVALFNALGVERAHLVGFSMGGMIAQTMAVGHPDRVASLTSIMSSTGSLRKGRPALRFLCQALDSAPSTQDEAILKRISMARARAAGGIPDSETELLHAARRSVERASDESGARRQLAAMLASGNRTARLKEIAAPTLVIHGLADRFVHPSGGRATAAAIPGAKLCLIENMAHNLPPALRPEVVDLITENAARAQSRPRADSGRVQHLAPSKGIHFTRRRDA